MAKRRKHEGHYYREPGFQCYRVQIDGRLYVRKARTASALREKVYALHRDLKAAREPGRSPRLAAYLASWISALQDSGARANTIRSYSRSADYLNAEIGNVRLDALTTGQIELALREIAKRGTRTAVLARDMLRSALKSAERDGLIERNPARFARAPRHEPRQPRLLRDAQEVKALLRALQGRYSPVLRFVLFTGVRISEALALSTFDISGGAVRIRSGKTAAAKRLIPLGPSAQSAVDDMLELRRQDAETPPWEDSGRLFTTSTGKPMQARNCQRALDTALRKAGVPHLSLHDLRRTFGTHLAAAGVDEAALKALMGHSDIRTTQEHYVLALQSRMEAAVITLESLAGQDDPERIVTEIVTAADGEPKPRRKNTGRSGSK